MSILPINLSLFTALLVGVSPLAFAGEAKLELVMSEGDRIVATTTSGKIEIVAGNGLNRCSSREGETRSAELWPRTKMWYGSMGAYYPGPGEHWKNHNGITRGVLQEGQQHFTDREAAKKWLDQQGKWYATVYTNSGLVVSFDKVLGRRQLNVEVWQITINGKPPQKLEGADDAKVRFVKSKKAEQGGTGQPATRTQSKSKGSDKPQPEAEGRSR